MRGTTSRNLARLVMTGVAVFSISAPGAGAGEPVAVQAAQSAFNDAYRQEDWPQAIEVGLDLVQMVPENAHFKYNLACVYALKGDAGSALHWLGRAAASGFADLALFDADSDLTIVRDRPGFSNVRAQVAENRGHRDLNTDRRAASSPVLIVAPNEQDLQRPAPLVVAFHGYGDRPENYLRFWKGPAGEFGAILAAPRGLRPVGNGFGWGNLDEADAIFRRTLDEVRRRYDIDRDRVIVTGFSQGAFIAMALGLRHPELLAGVIPIAGPYVPEVDAPPQAAGGGPKFLFMVGERDRAVADVRRAARDYEAAGYFVRLRVFQDTGHNFPRESDRELSAGLSWVLDE